MTPELYSVIKLTLVLLFMGFVLWLMLRKTD